MNRFEIECSSFPYGFFVNQLRYNMKKTSKTSFLHKATGSSFFSPFVAWRDPLDRRQNSRVPSSLCGPGAKRLFSSVLLRGWTKKR